MKASVFIVLSLSIIFGFGAAAVDAQAKKSSSDCLRFGPYDPPMPSWALMSTESKIAMCQQQRAINRREEEQRQEDVYRQRQSEMAPAQPILAVPTPVSSSGHVISSQPKFTTDGQTVVLIEEIREPARERRPEVSLGTQPGNGAREVRVSGQGIIRIPHVDIVCAGSQWRLVLSAFVEGNERNVASFAVFREVETAVSKLDQCRLVVGGAQLTLPRDSVRGVWTAK